MSTPSDQPGAGLARERARKIATIALHRAMAGDLPGAADYVKHLNGTAGLFTAVIGWCDTYIRRIHGPDAYGKRIQITYWDIETGALESDPSKVTPARRWAGEILAARVSYDEAAFMALMRQPAEGSELGDSIMALLHLVAESLKHLPHVDTESATTREAATMPAG